MYIYMCVCIYIYIYSATEQLNGELHKSEVLLIAGTLLVVKAENIS